MLKTHCKSSISSLVSAIALTILPAPVAQSFDLLVTSAANNGNSQVLRFDGQTGAFLGEFARGGGVMETSMSAVLGLKVLFGLT